ncbi:MAG: excinuclease ABC subunit UvrB [Spirochaetes bacterium]|nr:excinuclease ABC subunit UvrB [Spirochaetota bacterium]
MNHFKIKSDFPPAGDQPQAIDALVNGIRSGKTHQTLLGVTGSGKTFTIANVIEKLNKPTLVLSHNKTLAAQLYREFRDFFPDNAVEYFVSYYDYYQPEAYVPSKDLYIDKDAQINDEIDRLRLKATTALLERNDVIIVASVSCIYGLGSPEDYRELYVGVEAGKEYDRDEILKQLVKIQYTRSTASIERAQFRVIGDVIEVMSAYSDDITRIEMFGNTVERISRVNPITRNRVASLPRAVIYPAKHFVTTREKIDRGVKLIEDELAARYAELTAQKKILEAERIMQRTRYDIEMLREMGYCSGIENYSRPLSGRKEGERPACLLDYFPKEFLTVVDESHVTLPQVRGMYFGDRSRKQTLVDFGFRLPSALDNRPLIFKEFESIIHERIYVSATPSDYELSLSGTPIEQVIRPTGLVDPMIEVKPCEGQIDHLLGEISRTVKSGARVLVTTLTKKMAEDLTQYLSENGVLVRYLHSDIETIERVEIIRDLRLGVFNVLIGINLLREGLDMPEVSLVAILDADKVGFLRSATSLIQTVGRAARNVEGRVIMYADRMSDAMEKCIRETQRRREKQTAYNEANGITPKTIIKKVQDIVEREVVVEKQLAIHFDFRRFADENKLDPDKDKKRYLAALEAEMHKAAGNLEFEKAIELREKIASLGKSGKRKGKTVSAVPLKDEDPAEITDKGTIE